MSSLALVRAEIKAWERDFASTHGRDPSLQDIRDQPRIADKYKLHKKLSRAATNPPPTPSRLPAAKSRATESVPPLPGFNPFSPAKKSTKHNPSTSHPNPFATPAKNKAKPRPHTPSPSPEPLPSVLRPRPHVHRVSTTAVSRARKRLRGESVSPSPNKPKRQRIRAQAPPPVPESDPGSSCSEHGPDQGLVRGEFTSFVADSPVKAPAGGKSFKLLFDDALPSLSIPKKPVASSIDSPDPTGLSQRAPAKSREAIASGPEYRASRTQGKVLSQIFPEREHPHALPPKTTLKTVVSENSQPKTSMKRTLDGGDFALEQAKTSVPLQSQYSLIPPSPPPQDSINRDSGKGKAKLGSRKKLRVEGEESSEGVDSRDDVTLKVATIGVDRAKQSYRHGEDLDWDPLLYLRTRNHDPDLKEQIDANHHALGTFSVNLPDRFRRVLAISPSRSRDNEERVVRGLLYGDRIGHYNPFRGGDIWDAGEMDEGTLGDIEAEDDWEGEPVPWDVGEL